VLKYLSKTQRQLCCVSNFVWSLAKDVTKNVNKYASTNSPWKVVRRSSVELVQIEYRIVVIKNERRKIFLNRLCDVPS